MLISRILSLGPLVQKVRCSGLVGTIVQVHLKPGTPRKMSLLPHQGPGPRGRLRLVFSVVRITQDPPDILQISQGSEAVRRCRHEAGGWPREAEQGVGGLGAKWADGMRVLGIWACSQHVCSGACAPRWDYRVETQYLHTCTCLVCACYVHVWVPNPRAERGVHLEWMYVNVGMCMPA